MIVLQFLFDSQHLEKYITQRIKQFSSHVRVVDNITQALNSSETEQIIEERLTYLYSQPESYLLEQLGLKKEVVKPMIKPSIVSLCAESAPYVLDMVAESGQVMIIHVFRVLVVDYVCKYTTDILQARVFPLATMNDSQRSKHFVHSIDHIKGIQINTLGETLTS